MYTRELFIVMYNTLEATTIYESTLGLLGKLVLAGLRWNYFHASCMSVLYIWFKQNVGDNLVSEIMLQVLQKASESSMSFRILIKRLHYKQEYKSGVITESQILDCHKPSLFPRPLGIVRRSWYLSKSLGRLSRLAVCFTPLSSLISWYFILELLYCYLLASLESVGN